jgi:hypothetical protein
MALKVIGAGFGRTGTMSLKHALEYLGFGPCYHMIELTNEPGRVSAWEKAANGNLSALEGIFQDFQSVTDFPGCLFYNELLKKYPNAKVILTIRDPEDWFRSASKTIFKSYPSSRQLIEIIFGYPFRERIRLLMRVGWLINKLIFHRTFKFQFRNKKKAIEIYKNHNAKVVRDIPAEQLLIYDISEGWEPLCRFLGVPVPDRPFPNTNSSSHFVNMKNATLKAPVSEEMKRM